MVTERSDRGRATAGRVRARSLRPPETWSPPRLDRIALRSSREVARRIGGGALTGEPADQLGRALLRGLDLARPAVLRGPPNDGTRCRRGGGMTDRRGAEQDYPDPSISSVEVAPEAALSLAGFPSSASCLRRFWRLPSVEVLLLDGGRAFKPTLGLGELALARVADAHPVQARAEARRIHVAVHVALLLG